MNKYLDYFHKSIQNAFLGAIQNDETIKAIQEYRDAYKLHGHAKSPSELGDQIMQIFLQDAGIVDGAEVSSGKKIRREGNKVFVSMMSGERSTEWEYPNPFYAADEYPILEPENKLRLIEILSDAEKLSEFSWIFEQRLLTHETMIVYPSSNILIDILNNSIFLKRLRRKILIPLSLDYFLHWPLFFYYILTDDVEFVKQIINDLKLSPYRLFIFEDDAQTSWTIRGYGNANPSLLQKFIKKNKPQLIKLNTLINNPYVTGRSPKELEELLASKAGASNDDLAFTKEFRNEEINSFYLRTLSRQASKTGKVPMSFELRKNPGMRQLDSAKKRVKAYKSRAKSSSQSMSNVPAFKPEIKELVDEINKNY